MKRPSIFEHHNYRTFLGEWFAYLKAHHQVSIRSLAKDSGLSAGFISNVVNGNNVLSESSIESLSPHLRLSSQELRYLEYLTVVGESEDLEERRRAFEGIQRILKKQKINPQSLQTKSLLGKWLHATIHQMADLSGFKLDAKWIQKRLHTKVHLKEIESAVKHFKANPFLLKLREGEGGQETLNLEEGFYKLVLHQFHGEMLERQREAIYQTDRSSRSQRGFTVAIPKEKFPEIRQTLYDALDKIVQITEDAKSKDKDSVYHVSLGAFPLAELKKGSGDD